MTDKTYPEQFGNDAPSVDVEMLLADVSNGAGTAYAETAVAVGPSGHHQEFDVTGNQTVNVAAASTAALGAAIAAGIAGNGEPVNNHGQVTTALTLTLGLNTAKLTHADACVLTFPASPPDGAKCSLLAQQDTTASYNGTITHTGVKNAGGGAIAAQTASTGAWDFYSYQYSATAGFWLLTNIRQALA